MIQARSTGSTTPVGTWSTSVSNTKTTTCTSSADTLTHSSTTNKATGSSFTWTAPQSSDPGTIKFHLTVATAKATWWKGIESSSLTSSDYTENNAEKTVSNILLSVLTVA